MPLPADWSQTTFGTNLSGILRPPTSKRAQSAPPRDGSPPRPVCIIFPSSPLFSTSLFPACSVSLSNFAEALCFFDGCKILRIFYTMITAKAVEARRSKNGWFCRSPQRNLKKSVFREKERVRVIEKNLILEFYPSFCRTIF